MLRTLKEAVAYFEETLASRPERDALAADEAVVKGVSHRYPVFGINHKHDPGDVSESETFFVLPERKFADDDEGRLAERIITSLSPLDMLNPVGRTVGLEGSRSPADLVPSFGIPLGEDGGAPAYTLPLEDALKLAVPDPENAGIMPTFKQSAAKLRRLLPAHFKIGLPDMQGPFNLAHAMIGNDAFTAPYTDPEAYQAFMERITVFWIAARELLVTWVGEDRLHPGSRVPRIAECSVNMVSEDFYKEHILPYDLKIAQRFGPLHIHPCSGIHVFKATLENLPVASTEAGMMIAKMAAPVISVREGLARIGGRPVGLHVGQELPEDRNEAFKIVADDIELAVTNPRIRLGGYTGIFWKKKDRPMIRELHQELDAYWERKMAPWEAKGGVFCTTSLTAHPSSGH